MFAVILRLHGAIPVGPGGTGVLTFNTLPTTSEWSTWSKSGGSADIPNSAALDVEVQVLSASDITNALPVTSSTPPATAQLGRWNQRLQLLQTKLDGTSFIVLMASLQNRSGRDLTELHLRYEMSSGLNLSEQVPGYRVYFSLTGHANTWQLIPDLSTGVTGVLSANIDLGIWPSNAPLYVLFADDNGLNTDPYYTIDNFAAWPVLSSTNCISVDPNGTFTNAFTNFASTAGWTTRNFNFGSHTNITNNVQFDAAVQAFSANLISDPIGNTYTTPPDTGSRADWHGSWECLVSSSVAVDFTPLMATLRNDTGAEQFALDVFYLGLDGVSNVLEDVPRFRAYQSATGLPGQWRVIPEFINATGSLTARLDLGRWPPGAPLFILWADDNGPANRGANSDSPREGINRIDDFSARPTPQPRLQMAERNASTMILTWPAAAQGFELQSKTDLLEPDWQPVASNLSPSNDLQRVRITNGNPAQFFQLKSP